MFEWTTCTCFLSTYMLVIGPSYSDCFSSFSLLSEEVFFLPTSCSFVGLWRRSSEAFRLGWSVTICSVSFGLGLITLEACFLLFGSGLAGVIRFVFIPGWLSYNDFGKSTFPWFNDFNDDISESMFDCWMMFYNCDMLFGRKSSPPISIWPPIRRDFFLLLLMLWSAFTDWYYFLSDFAECLTDPIKFLLSRLGVVIPVVAFFAIMAWYSSSL